METTEPKALTIKASEVPTVETAETSVKDEKVVDEDFVRQLAEEVDVKLTPAELARVIQQLTDISEKAREPKIKILEKALELIKNNPEELQKV